MKPTLHVDTSVGHFTRQTDTNYTHVVVWRSPRALGSLTSAHKSGVSARWAKDNGFGVTWHSSGKAAEAATRSYKWDDNATLVGVFAVRAPTPCKAPRVAVAHEVLPGSTFDQYEVK